MDQKYKVLVKNVGYLIISNFASKILVFLLVPLYTNALTTEEYGCYDAVVTTIQFITPLVILNITDGVMRYLLDKSNSEKEIIEIGNKYVVLGIVLSSIFLGLNSIFHVLSFLNGYEIYALGYSVFYLLNSYYIQYAKGLNQVKVMAVAGTLGTISTLVANIVLLYYFKCGVEGFFVANILGIGIPTFFYFVKLKAWENISFRSNNKVIEKNMLLYSIPLIFNTIGWTINSSLDKYCVIYFMGISASGLLAIAYKIPTILNVLYSMFTQAWQISAVTEYDSEDRIKFFSNTFLFINAIGSLGCAGLIVINKVLARILFANDFYQAWKFVPFLLLSTMFNQTAGVVGPLLSAKRDSNAIAKAAIWGAVSNFIFNIVMIKVIGIQGVAIATAMSSFVIYFVRWWYAKDLLDSQIYRPIYISWILLLISSIAEVCEIQYIVQCIILLCIIIVFRKQYINVLKIIFKRK